MKDSQEKKFGYKYISIFLYIQIYKYNTYKYKTTTLDMTKHC